VTEINQGFYFSNFFISQNWQIHSQEDLPKKNLKYRPDMKVEILYNLAIYWSRILATFFFLSFLKIRNMAN
jgi:hypothetical protein